MISEVKTGLMGQAPLIKVGRVWTWTCCTAVHYKYCL